MAGDLDNAALSKRIDELSVNLEKLTTHVEKLTSTDRSSHPELREMFQEQNLREMIEQSVRGIIEASIGSLKNDFEERNASLKNDFASLKYDFASLKNDFTTMSSKFDTMNSRLESVEYKFSAFTSSPGQFSPSLYPHRPDAFEKPDPVYAGFNLINDI